MELVVLLDMIDLRDIKIVEYIAHVWCKTTNYLFYSLFFFRVDSSGGNWVFVLLFGVIFWRYKQV